MNLRHSGICGGIAVLNDISSLLNISGTMHLQSTRRNAKPKLTLREVNITSKSPDEYIVIDLQEQKIMCTKCENQLDATQLVCDCGYCGSKVQLKGENGEKILKVYNNVPMCPNCVSRHLTPQHTTHYLIDLI